MILEMKNVTKTYPNGVIANNAAFLRVNSGEIHSVVGENGAGKTTLMKVLFGLVTADSGEIIFDGEKIENMTPHKALKKGIGMVHQHFALATSLTVAENLIIGMEPKRFFQIDRRKSEEILQRLSNKFGLHVDSKAVVADTPIGMRQKLEILKILYRGARFLILDEPTAVLTPQETSELFQALGNLKAEGYTIVFISHKLREVLRISDKITVMRRGSTVSETTPAETNEAELSRMMVGRDVVFQVPKPPVEFGEKILEVKDLEYWSREGKHILKSVNLSIRAGEILGIAGVEGNGQRELIEIIAGLRKPQGGQILIEGKDVAGSRPKHIRNMKVAHIPEDRMSQGVAADATIEENLIANRYDRMPSTLGLFMKRSVTRKLSSKLIEDFGIAASSCLSSVKMLSGGNIQKVVVSRELSMSPRLLLANQPTRGVDVGAIEFIHSKLIDARKNLAAILLISSELREVLSLSDRLLVMYEGEIVGVFSEVSRLTEEEVGLYMLGLKRQEKAKIMEYLS